MKTQKGLLFVGLFLAVTLAFALSASTAMAQKVPPPCNPAKDVCDLCHNIGGPNALGANCDAGNCDSILDTGDAELIANYGLAVALAGSAANQIYGGIVVPFGDAAFTAHFNHGDGFTLVTFDRVHDTQPHVAANVGCFAVRHDPDPGN